MAGETIETVNYAITISDWVMIGAVLLAPVIAVQVEKFLERKRESRGSKLWVFKTLMATRGKMLDPNHVQALNMIDLEFVGKKYKAVSSAWKALLDHLVNTPTPPSFGDQNYNDLKTAYDTNFALWSTKIEDYQAALLYEMSKSLGFDFDETHIKKAIYSPKGHGDLENEQNLLLKGVLAVLGGNIAVPMEIRNWPTNE